MWGRRATEHDELAWITPRPTARCQASLGAESSPQVTKIELSCACVRSCAAIADVSSRRRWSADITVSATVGSLAIQENSAVFASGLVAAGCVSTSPQ